jgi:hypothetical protein
VVAESAERQSRGANRHDAGIIAISSSSRRSPIVRRTGWTSRGVIVRQASRLDWRYVHAELAPLAELKEAPEILTRLQRLRERLEE